MFDKDSFTDEITDAAEAKASVAYLAHNETKFRSELNEEGLSHDEQEAAVKEVWANLVATCRRVKYTDSTIAFKIRQFSSQLPTT